MPSSRKFDEVSASLFYKIQPRKVVFLGMPETWTSYDLDSLSMPDAKVQGIAQFCFSKSNQSSVFNGGLD